MASKTDSPAAETNNFNFILTVLKHCESIKCDWQAAGDELGVKYGKNVASKFRDLIKKHGFKLENNQMVKIDSDTIDTITPKKSPAALKTAKKVEKAKDTATPNSSAKKRKLAVMEEDTNDDQDNSKVKAQVGDDNGQGKEEMEADAA